MEKGTTIKPDGGVIKHVENSQTIDKRIQLQRQGQGALYLGQGAGALLSALYHSALPARPFIHLLPSAPTPPPL